MTEIDVLAMQIMQVVNSSFEKLKKDDIVKCIIDEPMYRKLYNLEEGRVYTVNKTRLMDTYMDTHYEVQLKELPDAGFWDEDYFVKV